MRTPSRSRNLLVGVLFSSLLSDNGSAFAPFRPSFLPPSQLSKKLHYKPSLQMRNTCRFLTTDSSQDGEALQALFAQTCDRDGLMTKDALKRIPSIAELLVSLCQSWWLLLFETTGP
jgi:hypothetical protein